MAPTLAALAIGFAVAALADPGWGVAAGLAVYLLADIHRARAFRAWARAPLRAPRLSSAWQPAARHLRDSLLRSRRRARQLIGELRWLQGTLDSIPDGWIVLQRDGTIEAVNRGASGLLGFALRDRRRKFTELVKDPAVAALLDDAADDDIIELPSPVDESRRLELRHIRVDAERSLVLIRDVTMLDRLLTMRQDFIANVSHELRTPLTVVIGYLETLEEDGIDAATLRQLLGKLRSPADRMKALVEDLLTLTRLESSPMPAAEDIECVDVAGLLRLVVDEARELALPSHRIALDADAQVTARGVPVELHSAFFNLVANAIRYSPDGGAVSVRWGRGATGPRFEVEDCGLGIPPEHLSRLTERFFRVDLAKSRVRGGTGLGLAIVKHILRRHRTQLGVRSEFGKGSLFYFELPDDALPPGNGGRQRPQTAAGG